MEAADFIVADDGDVFSAFFTSLVTELGDGFNPASLLTTSGPVPGKAFSSSTEPFTPELFTLLLSCFALTPGESRPSFAPLSSLSFFSALTIVGGLLDAKSFDDFISFGDFTSFSGFASFSDFNSLVEADGEVGVGDFGDLVIGGDGGGGDFGDFTSCPSGDLGLFTEGGERGDFMVGGSGFLIGAGGAIERELGAEDRLAASLAGGDDGDGDLAGELEFPESRRTLGAVVIVADAFLFLGLLTVAFSFSWTGPGLASEASVW